MVTDFTFMGMLSFAVGFAALGITIIIAHNQGKLTNEIHKSVQESKELLDGTRTLYATAFVKHVGFISERYAHASMIYLNNSNQSTSMQKEMIQILKQYYDTILINNFPKIEAIELVKIFGREIADKYLTCTVEKTSSMWEADKEHNMKLMICHLKKQMQKLVELKDAFLPFCTESDKNYDSKFQDNYDLIKDLAKEAEREKEDLSSSTSL